MKYGFGLLLLLIAWPMDAQADIYKCVAENGAVSYSQIPCPKQKTTKVETTAPAKVEPVDCRWASTFAGDVARRMRGGMASDQLFNLYGGIDAVSTGTVNIINYVYRFRGNDSMANERIASLAASMCEAGSLGDVRCESLPYGQDPTSNRCDPDAEEAAVAMPLPAPSTQALAAQNTQAAVKTDRASAAREQQRYEECRDNYRDQIDAIDAQMRNGYDSEQGEIYREQLRTLTTRMRAC